MKLNHYLWFFSQPPLPALLMISMLAWFLLWAGGHHQTHPIHQPATITQQHHVAAELSQAQDVHHHSEHQVPDATHEVTNEWQMLSHTMGWTLMIFAMMFPLLHNAIRHIWRRSLPRLRFIGTTLFCLVYLALWTVVGLLCNELMSYLQHVANWMVFSCGLIVLLLWQACPIKQWALNYCHYTQRLALSGMAYGLDCCRFALKKSFWCIVSCWHLMVYPMLFESFLLMFVAMMVACVWMFIEQHLSPRPTRWSWPFRAELAFELYHRSQAQFSPAGKTADSN
jgi:hypothetical protein